MNFPVQESDSKRFGARAFLPTDTQVSIQIKHDDFAAFQCPDHSECAARVLDADNAQVLFDLLSFDGIWRSVQLSDQPIHPRLYPNESMLADGRIDQMASIGELDE